MSFTKVAAPPPAPAAVDPGQASLSFIQAMASPELQGQLFNAEATYRPQYTALSQRDLQNTLLGVAPGTAEGFYGTLDLADMAARRQAALQQSLQTQATEFGLAQLGAYAPQAREAYLAANPQMAAALAQAESFGGRQASGYLNEMGRLAMQPASQAQINPYGGVGGGNVNVYGSAQQQQQQALADAQQIAGAQSGQPTAPAANIPAGIASQLRGVMAANRAEAAGGSPAVGMPGAVRADQVTSGGVLTPQQVQAERVQAERVRAGQVEAGQVGAGALGQSLYQQALQSQQLSPLSQALQSQGLAMAQAPGQLTPDELRAATQGARERFASTGRLEDIAGVTGEALARAGASRERQFQNLAAAQGINAQLLGAQQAGQQLATDVLRTDIQRQQANVGTQLQAGQFNVEALLRGDLANQQTGLQANLANQDAFLRAQLANQQAGMQAGMFNISNAQDVQRLNQAANLQANLANQANQQRGFEFVTGTNLQTQLANRDFAAQQAQQRFGNLGAVLGSEQAMLGADRAYALQQAAQQGGVTAASLGLIGFGQTPTALQFGAQQQGISQGQMGTGPTLFDPNAGINLALMNASNLGNYQASTYGARAAAQGQIAGATIGAIGNVASAFVPKIPGLGGPATPPCWVAREVYGEDNPKWLMFREWLFTKAPSWFRSLYIQHGERFAAFLRTKTTLKRLIRKWMDSRIKTLALA
jgi:hypothetical protein